MLIVTKRSNPNMGIMLMYIHMLQTFHSFGVRKNYNYVVKEIITTD